MNAVNPFDLSDTTTLIIGGRGAMGSAIARCAAACGSRIIIGERQPEPNNGNGDSVLFDATSEDSARAALAELGSLDHVVVAISARANGGSIAETSPAEASQAFKRFWANYNVLHLLPGRLKPNGSVTLISGSSARRPGPGFGLWTTMHGAIEALARAATIELAPIRVNVSARAASACDPIAGWRTITAARKMLQCLRLPRWQARQ